MTELRHIKTGTLLPRMDAAIFDKDGTLIDIHHYWGSMIRCRALTLSEDLGSCNQSTRIWQDHLMHVMGVDPSNMKMKPEGPVGIKLRGFIVEQVAQAYRNSGADVSLVRVEEIFSKVDRATESRIGDFIKPLPGVEAFLKRCKERGVYLAVATTDHFHRAKAGLSAIGMFELFDEVVGGDQVSKAKPAPDLGLEILKRLNVKAENCAMFGDHRVDMEMARNCAMGASIMLLTGLGKASDLQTDTGMFVVDTFLDLEIIA